MPLSIVISTRLLQDHDHYVCLYRLVLLTENQDLVAKIRWQCRRGMLELDFILKQFIDTGLDAYDRTELINLQLFLDNQDPDLFTWFMGHGSPSEDNDKYWVTEILNKQSAS